MPAGTSTQEDQIIPDKAEFNKKFPTKERKILSYTSKTINIRQLQNNFFGKNL